MAPVVPIGTSQTLTMDSMETTDTTTTMPGISLHATLDVGIAEHVTIE